MRSWTCPFKKCWFHSCLTFKNSLNHNSWPRSIFCYKKFHRFENIHLFRLSINISNLVAQYFSKKFYKKLLIPFIQINLSWNPLLKVVQNTKRNNKTQLVAHQKKSFFTSNWVKCQSWGNYGISTCQQSCTVQLINAKNELSVLPWHSNFRFLFNIIKLVEL